MKYSLNSCNPITDKTGLTISMSALAERSNYCVPKHVTHLIQARLKAGE